MESIPDLLKGFRQWLVWRYEKRKGSKPTKVPYQTTGKHAKSNDPSTWSDFDSCVRALATEKLDGIGFAFAKGDGLCGIDLDNCYSDDGNLIPWAQAIVDQFAGTYVEKSPSGNGLHIWCLGIPLKTGEERWKDPGADVEQGIEVYDHESPRYFTVTGNVIAGQKITDCQSALEWLYQQYFIEESYEPVAVRSSYGALDVEQVYSALTHIPADDYKLWVKIGMALKAAGISCVVWDTWSKKSSKYEPGICQEKWETFNGTGIGPGTIFHHAKQHGYRFQSNRYRLDDIGNAQRFVDCYGNDVRWFPAINRYLVWDGVRWKVDEISQVIAFAKDTARKIFQEAADCTDTDISKRIADWASKSASAPRLEAMLKLARPHVAVTASLLDQDSLKLNCLNGTLDLHTGNLMPHRREDLITRLVAVEYHPNATAPRFMQFLGEIFAGSFGLIDFLECTLGYSLTGSVNEQKLFVCFGAGQNGKSTLFNVIRNILGDYAQEADPSLLLAKQNNGGATPGVARLRGVRLSTTMETPEGARLNETLVKHLTGGDKMIGRPLYGDFMEFEPTHKLFMITNDKPIITSQSIAMWRRIKMIPFNVQVPETQKEHDLPEKLRAESAGILAWMVRGCLKWQAEGLPEPSEVQNATADYKSEQDSLAKFIEDCCRMEQSAQVQSSHLRERYKWWCAQNGELSVNRNQFTKRMREKGFTSKETREATFWLGIRLSDMGEVS